MNTLLDMMQTKQLKLYQYEKSQNEIAIRLMIDEISDLQKVIDYLADKRYKQDINLPSKVIIQILKYLEEYSEIKSQIEDIEFYIEIEFGDDFEDEIENNLDYHLNDLQDKLDNVECEIYNLIEKHLNVS